MTKKEAEEFCKLVRCSWYRSYKKPFFIKGQKTFHCPSNNDCVCWWIEKWFVKYTDIKNYFEREKINEAEVFEKLKPFLMIECLKGAKK